METMTDKQMNKWIQRVDRWTDKGLTDRQMNGWLVRHADEMMVGSTVRWTDGQTVGSTDRQRSKYTDKSLVREGRWTYEQINK